MSPKEESERWRAMNGPQGQNARGTTEEAHVSAPRREEAGEDARVRCGTRAGGRHTIKKEPRGLVTRNSAAGAVPARPSAGRLRTRSCPDGDSC